MDVYDELPNETERQYLEWSKLPPVDELRIEIETDPIPGPEHPVGASDDATSEYSVLELDGTVVGSGAEPIDEGEYRLAVSSSRLARALGEAGVRAGDTILLTWTPDGEYRDYDVEVL
jgi:hypothetical protein